MGKVKPIWWQEGAAVWIYMVARNPAYGVDALALGVSKLLPEAKSISTLNRWAILLKAEHAKKAAQRARKVAAADEEAAAAATAAARSAAAVEAAAHKAAVSNVPTRRSPRVPRVSAVVEAAVPAAAQAKRKRAERFKRSPKPSPPCAPQTAPSAHATPGAHASAEQHGPAQRLAAVGGRGYTSKKLEEKELERLDEIRQWLTDMEGEATTTGMDVEKELSELFRGNTDTNFRVNRFVCSLPP